ncbi:MAG: alkaline phosphatase [Planctomycetota bacterium]|nr:alkaline phosphatase [Planctomycetota bacterium]
MNITTKITYPILVALTVLGIAPTSAQKSSPSSKTSAPKNVIIMIGDGMGLNQVALGRILAGDPGTPLSFEKLPIRGYLSTHSSSHIVTDSAASATALATGQKVPNHVIAITGEGKPIRNLFEAAHDRGLRTGIVTNTRLTHATPAAFSAHVVHRSQEKSIAAQMTRNKSHVLLGGGGRVFSAEMRKEYVQAGYDLVTDPKSLAKSRKSRIIGLFHSSHMSFEQDRNPETEPSLADMTAKALKALSIRNPGFLLLVEGGRIDHGGHAHDGCAIAHQTIAFAKAVEVAVSFARKNKNTLIFITADHPTGGLAISESVDPKMIRSVPHSSEWISKKIKSGADLASAWKEGTGLDPLNESERATIENPNLKLRMNTKIGHVLSARAGLHFYPLEVQATHYNTSGHDGLFVPYYAYGTRATSLIGMMDQTDVPKRIARLLGLNLHSSSKSKKKSTANGKK